MGRARSSLPEETGPRRAWACLPRETHSPAVDAGPGPGDCDPNAPGVIPAADWAPLNLISLSCKLYTPSVLFDNVIHAKLLASRSRARSAVTVEGHSVSAESKCRNCHCQNHRRDSARAVSLTLVSLYYKRRAAAESGPTGQGPRPGLRLDSIGCGDLSLAHPRAKEGTTDERAAYNRSGRHWPSRGCPPANGPP